MTFEEYVKKSKETAKEILSGFDEKEVSDFLNSEEVEKELLDHWKTHDGKINTIGYCLALMF